MKNGPTHLVPCPQKAQGPAPPVKSQGSCTKMRGECGPLAPGEQMDWVSVGWRTASSRQTNPGDVAGVPHPACATGRADQAVLIRVCFLNEGVSELR